MATMKHEGVLKFVNGEGNINILYPAIGEEITQAAYDELPEEDKLSGTYWIEDGEGGSGGASIDLDPTLSVEGKAADAKAVGDAITTGFNNETGYLKVLKDGQWIETNVRAYSDRIYLVEEGINNDKVSLFAGGTVGFGGTTQGGSLTYGDGVTNFSFNAAGASECSLMSNELYDLNPCTKIVLHYKTTYSATALDDYYSALLFVTDKKQGTMTPSCSSTLCNKVIPAQEGIIELDISALEGMFYIGIRSIVNADTINVHIYDWYFE